MGFVLVLRECVISIQFLATFLARCSEIAFFCAKRYSREVRKWGTIESETVFVDSI